MVNPLTVNVGIIVPLTGADVDLWGEADVNPNMVAIDAMFAGVQTIALTNAPVTLTKPAAFTPTPSPGPTQSQNRVLRFTGAITADVRVTLPLPGSYLIDNRTTQAAGGNFAVSFQGVIATEVIATPQGTVTEIYNDGANVRFSNFGKPGQLEFWAGQGPSMPSWVTQCTVPPYLLTDGTLHNFSDFTWLGARLLAQFGGNGVTTFLTPDLWGRVPLSYDNTGFRITAAGCGINGQQMGSQGGSQGIAIDTSQMPSHYHVAGIYDPGHAHSYNYTQSGGNQGGGGAFGFNITGAVTSSNATGVRVNSPNGLDTTYSSGSGLAHPNVQPSQVAGIWVIKT